MKNAAPMQQHYDTSSVFVAVIGRQSRACMKEMLAISNVIAGEEVGDGGK